MHLELAARPPFSLASVISSHGWVQLAPFEREDGAESLTFVDRLASGRAVALWVAASPAGVAIDCDPALAPAEIAEIQRKVAWMVGLDQDFAAFYRAAAHEPKLAHAAANAQGRLLRSPSLFEDTVKTMLTTNTTWSGTKRMVRTLVTAYGDAVADGTERRAFPTPERIAASDEASLRRTIGLGYRAPYVLELAQRVASGDLDLDALSQSSLPTPDLRKRLLAIKGVGPYAAANLLMILGRYDYIPVDSWALKLVSHEWHHGQAIGPAAVEAAFEGWGEWKGLAFWMWNWDYTATQG